MRIELRHRFSAPPDRAWDILFGDAYEDAVAAQSRLERQILSDEERGGERIRKIHVVPEQPLPTAAAKLTGTDRLSYTLEERHQPARQHMDFTVTPDVLPGKVTVEGSWQLSPAPGGCERLVTIDVRVKVPVVGSRIEKQIAADLRRSYEEAAVFAQKWIQEHA